MIILSSPAKSQDFESDWKADRTTTPEFIKEASELVENVRNLSKTELKSLLKVSDSLADFNYKRFKVWKKKPAKSATKPAILAYTGDVYQQLQASMYTKNQQEFAQQSVRIISGLYGLLRPYDVIQPYRLEMNARLKTTEGKDLYAFWQNKLTDHLKEVLEKDSFPVVINLASQEYSKAIDFEALQVPYYFVEFRQKKAGKTGVIGLHAKKARGMMLEHLISCRAKSLDQVTAFHSDTYKLIGQKDNQITFEKILE